MQATKFLGFWSNTRIPSSELKNLRYTIQAGMLETKKYKVTNGKNHIKNTRFLLSPPFTCFPDASPNHPAVWIWFKATATCLSCKKNDADSRKDSNQMVFYPFHFLAALMFWSFSSVLLTDLLYQFFPAFVQLIRSMLSSLPCLP